jgi:hypothetical protein
MLPLLLPEANTFALSAMLREMLTQLLTATNTVALTVKFPTL